LWYGDFFALYNNFENFWKLRRELDPHGRLLNTHLRRIFGEDGHVVS
jgi:FAD/FMN-containing dehydrogenase